jgi:hypothetical protein
MGCHVISENHLCKRLRIYLKLGTRVDQRTNTSATYIGFGLSRRSSSTNYRITLEQCQRHQEALELDVQQCQRSQEAPARPTQRSKDRDISNHNYTFWDEQALYVDTNVPRKRSKDHDISNHKYTCWDEQALHVDTNVALAYSVDTITTYG